LIYIYILKRSTHCRRPSTCTPHSHNFLVQNPWLRPWLLLWVHMGVVPTPKFLVGFVQIAWVVLYRHVVRFKLSANPKVVWSLVVTLELHICHWVCSVRLINITFKRQIIELLAQSWRYLTDNRTVSVRLVCDYTSFEGGGRISLLLPPGAENPILAMPW